VRDYVVMAECGTVVAVAQLALNVGEPDANRQAARIAIAQAALAGARLVVLPELSDSGYVFSDADEVRSLASPAASCITLREWRSLAARHDLAIAGGFCELGPDGRLYNSAAIVDASGTRAVYRKAHLWDACIAVADRCGTERGVDWLGGSVIVRRGGYPAAGPMCENRTAVLTATIDLMHARDKRISELNDLFTDRRPDLYARLWDVTQSAGSGRS
jgi:predicted amidohydrolase